MSKNKREHAAECKMEAAKLVEDPAYTREESVELLGTLFSNFSRDYGTLELENKNLKAELELKESSLKLRFEEIAKLTQLIMSQDAELVDLKANLSKEHKALKSLKAEHKDLGRSLKIAIKNRKRAEAARDELLAQNEVLNQQILESANTTVSAEKVEGLEKVLSDLRKTNKDLKADLKETQRELKIAFKKRKLAEQEREVLQAKLNHEASFTGFGASEDTQVVNAEVTTEQVDDSQMLVSNEISDLYENLQEQISFIRESGFFDANWYLANYPDVAQAKIDPLEHFVKYGWLEDRSPSAEFDVAWYLSEYPDVAMANMNPLLHYIYYGEAEGRFAVQPKMNVYQ